MTDRDAPTPREIAETQALDEAIKGFNQQITTAFGGHDFRHINATVIRFKELIEGRGEWINTPTEIITRGLMDMDAHDASQVYIGTSDDLLEFGHLRTPENSRRPGEAGPYIEHHRRVHYFERDETYDSRDLAALDPARTLIERALKHQPNPHPEIENPNPEEKHPEKHQVVRDMVERVFAGLGGDRFTFLNASVNPYAFIRLENNERDDLSQWGYGYELKIEKHGARYGEETVLFIPGLDPYQSEPIPVMPWFNFRAPGYRSPLENETKDPEAVRRVYEFLDEVLPLPQAT